MTSSGRWGWFCAVVLAVLLFPCRVFAVDKLLIVNGTDLTMKAGTDGAVRRLHPGGQ